MNCIMSNQIIRLSKCLITQVTFVPELISLCMYVCMYFKHNKGIVKGAFTTLIDMDMSTMQSWYKTKLVDKLFD